MKQRSEHHLTFLGAAEEVTGSCYLLSTEGNKYLLDCGIHQGGSAVKRIEDERFRFDPAEIHAVFLSHAHLDHSGLLPKLIHDGFDGPIYCTRATHRLLEVLLEDALGLYLRDLEYQNRRLARAGKPPVEPQYSESDVEGVLRNCETLEYGAWHTVNGDLRLRFDNAGHILGAAIVSLEMGQGKGRRRLTFSGDLGNEDSFLSPPPTTAIEKPDILLLESTYGDRNHRAMDDTIEEFREIIRDADDKGGCILVPSFAVGRTQEILFILGQMYQEGLLEGYQIFLDSPMAQRVTGIYDRYRQEWDQEDQSVLEKFRSDSLREFLPNLHYTESVEESMALNQLNRGAIIIAGSGMCTGGRIRHHFKHRLWNKSTHVVFVGFQARGTLGRRLVDGAKKVRMFGHDFAVKAQIHTLGGFSAHADQRALVAWAGAVGDRARVMLVHGEKDAMVELSRVLWDERQIEADIASLGTTIHF